MREAQSGFRFSDFLFRKFLYAYPVEYRLEFGDEMTEVFGDLCLDVYRQRGFFGLAKLCAGTFIDLLRTALEEHWRKLRVSVASKMLAVGGWASIFGALVTLVFAMTHASPNWISWAFHLKGLWPAMGVFYLGGVAGLWFLKRDRALFLGTGPALAFAGALVLLVSGLLMFFMDRAWMSFRNGLLVLGAGLVWMGFSALRSGNRSHLKYILLGTGICMFLLFMFAPSGYMGRLFSGDTALFALLIGVGWFSIGLTLLRSKGGDYSTVSQ
jgi:hypothetical protein